jgi:FkbM family methyltransferase|tara:strand:- start:4454 stop:5143 length:690 start_codon:yes stop_codon:yes gene_type:complete
MNLNPQYPRIPPEAHYVESKTTGGHYAFQTEKASKPFQNNMRECKSIKLNDTDVVADIGAYVGEYSMWASTNGATRVLSYEPTPHSFELLTQNKLPAMEVFNLAVVGNDYEGSHTPLFISKGIGVTNSIVKSHRKDGFIKVKTIPYEEAIKDATVVKIDVEGAEYTYDIIQPQLRAIILEFHPISKKPWKVWANKIMESMEAAGFESIIRPTFQSGWSLTGSWERKLGG